MNYEDSNADFSDLEVMDEQNADVVVTADDQVQVILLLLEESFEGIIHDILIDIHRAEKSARLHSIVIELEQQAGKLQQERVGNEFTSAEPVVVETDAAILEDGRVRLKGDPFKTVKNIICPNCRLPRLLYPRVGFNSRPPPDPSQQYCKNEPVIIIDKHDVHGQRKKGVKMKGQAKGKNKKKNEAASPASSEKSDPVTPSANSGTGEGFEFKEIEVPAAKCPNKDSHLGDHWKSVNVFATHLTGSCYLKRDRAAGREANAKISGTPRESRASSPKATNGVKRKSATDESEGNGKKKQKLDTPKKNFKFAGAPSKLRDSIKEEAEERASFIENSDTIQVVGKVDSSQSVNGERTENKSKTNGVIAKKKPGKWGKKASGNN